MWHIIEANDKSVVSLLEGGTEEFNATDGERI
jgi:hypothetical protein